MKYFEVELKNLEDLLNDAGTATFCYNSEETTDDPNNLIGDPSISIVIHSDEQIQKVANFLKTHRSELLKVFGKDVEFSTTYLGYYLSYLYFGEYARSYENIFLSTSVVNIKNPDSLEIGQSQTLGFKVQIVAIIEGPADKTFPEIRDDVRLMAEDLNARSRYLKICSLEFGTLNSRYSTGTMGPQFTPIQLSLG